MKKRLNNPSWWALSFGAHFVVLGILAAVIVVGLPLDDVEAVSVKAVYEVPFVPDMTDPERRADDHPPIEPEVFQVDREIINVADRVVVDSTATNVDGSFIEGDTPKFVTNQSLRGPVFYDMIGGGGGSAGRRGSIPMQFG